MKYTITAAAILAASFQPAFAQNGCTKSPKGNWFCNPVKAISFTNFGKAGSYNKVTGMNTNDGTCSSQPQSYSGGVAPLDQEISWHFRGPMHLKQFAYYTPGSDSSKPKRDALPPPLYRRHGHHHDHLHNDEESHEKRALGDIVTATINGQVVSWTNAFSGGAAATDTPGAAPANAGVAASGAAPDNSYKPPPAPSGSWARQSYYAANTSTAQNIIFLNNLGGMESGVFDYKFGNSLSYATSDGNKAATSSQILSDTMLGDGTEIALFTGRQCQGSACGFYRPDSVAYHGFGGASKMFLLEFSMPLTGTTGANKDMPAVWILNALIPRTLQYGLETCSCWKSGCGEWDIFEVLESGRQECVATFHGGRSIGESDYFQRPTSKTMKAMVLFDETGASGSIVVIDDETDFGTVLGGDTVKKLLGAQGQAKVAMLPN